MDDVDNDAQEGEEAPTHTFDDDTKDDTADSQQVLSFVGAAQAPSNYKIRESCPSLETEENMRELIGAQILHAWDDNDRQGWFEARVCVCMGATSTREILRVLPQPIFLCDTPSR